jgi:putative glycosyltransferase (TIGR04372 family)
MFANRDFVDQKVLLRTGATLTPLDYIKAIKAVTKAGGWVFRMGDPSMTPLPKMPQVIDYAHNEIRCDWMDIFLGATFKFLIGTGSG